MGDIGSGSISEKQGQQPNFSAYKQRQQQQSKGDPNAGASTSSGVSAYQLRKQGLNAGTSSMTSSGGAQGKKSGGGAVVGSSLLAKIRNDPSWGAGAGGAESDDEIAEIDGF